MATIDRRVSTRGIVTWRVRWREGGRRTGASDGETCDSWEIARKFGGLVESAGERRPEGYPKGCRGRKPEAAEPKREPGSPTFAVVAAEYMATLADAQPRTIAEYWRDLRTHVLPAVVSMPDGSTIGPLGQLPIDEFTADVVQAWVNYMRAKKHGKNVKRSYSPKTIINIHGSVVSPVFDFAVFPRQYCVGNPCRRVRLPELKGRPIKAHHVLDIDEFEAWIGCAYEVDDDTGDITALILGTGIRWGELTALRKCDVKLRRAKKTGKTKGGRITITQVVKEDENRRPYIDSVEGKSGNAFRTIAIGTDAAEILAARMEGRASEDLLFPAPGTRGGWIWRNPNFYSHRWVKVKAIAAKRGLTKDPSPHRMRHAHATALIPLHGIESVSKRIGHANVTVTSATYSHLTEAVDAGMATSLDGRLRRKKRKKTKEPVDHTAA